MAAAPAATASPRVFSGVKPTGHFTLGNYLGAIQRWVEIDQHRTEALFCSVDLHALTVEHDPDQLRALTLEGVTTLLAAGLDPALCTVFVQSHVSAHTRLTWIMEAMATDGELRRMIQYREKSATQRTVRTALLTYPALMAADILAYRVEEVPVGEDQRQHVELARDLAQRFNHHYGETFPLPRAVVTTAARVMDLADPTAKMGKSSGRGPGVIELLDPPEMIRKKINRAVTDAEPTSAYDPENRPGVSNLLAVLGACTGENPRQLGFPSHGALKKATADAVVEKLRPIRERQAELAAAPDHVAAVLRAGAARAEELAAPTVAAAYRAIGLLEP